MVVTNSEALHPHVRADGALLIIGKAELWVIWSRNNLKGKLRRRNGGLSMNLPAASSKYMIDDIRLKFARASGLHL
jgi:hypothetical protein